MDVAAGAPPPNLPALRQELRLLPGETASDGEPTWLIFDPLRNAYQQINERAFQLLQLWQEEPAEQLLTRARTTLTPSLTGEEIKEMASFLYCHKLTTAPPGNDPSSFYEQEKAASPPWWTQIIHKYLFFRVPLFKPQRFLEKTYPFVRPLFQKKAWYVLGAILLAGIYFTARQWESFTQTFLHFLTFEGLIFYGLTLIVIKCIHELGHAFTAHHFKCRVPVIGVAFLVMFPILYTDTTNAWALTDRRKRLLIDAGGMAAELIIAALALFAWSFLPDGPLRSAAFFAATTSWALSLLVNLNPLMRFDGYYLMTDLSGISNLQQTGFAIGRWRLREYLFGLKAPAPVHVSPSTRTGLTIYAWCTWVYRFFLFLGIALFVHAFFAKALGIFLFIVEITWFIGKPIYSELKEWYFMRNQIRNALYTAWQGRLTLFSVSLLVLLFFAPWRTSIYAPALMQPVVQTDIHASTPALLTDIYINNGDRVKKDDLLFIFSSSQLNVRKKQTTLQIALLQAQLARRVADRQDLQDTLILKRELKTHQAQLAGLQALQKDLEIRAPHDGIIVDLATDLPVGRWVAPTMRLASVVNPDQMEIIALPNEREVARLQHGNRLVFIADDAFAPRVRAKIADIAPTSEAFLTLPTLSSTYKGPVAVRIDDQQRDVPEAAIFRLRATPLTPPEKATAIRGKVKIRAKPESPATALWRSVVRVLIRETDF